jgi:hypothetical protein
MLLIIERQVADIKNLWIALDASEQVNRHLIGALEDTHVELGYHRNSAIFFAEALVAAKEEAETHRLRSAASVVVLEAEVATHKAANAELTRQVSTMRHAFGAARQMIQNAQNDAVRAMRQCMDMRIADSGRPGPHRVRR